MVKTKEYEAFAKELKAYEKVVRAEYAGIEDAVSVKIRECEAPAEMVAREVAEKLTKAVVGCPDGVQKMSMAMPGLVQTSSNLARVVSDGKTVKLQCLLRSSVNTEKAALGEAIAAVFSLAGAKVQLSGSYDGWNPDMDSPILKAMTASYKALYGKQPAVTAIHAGLECGIIGSKYPKMDMISFGPTICYPHSPDEKVEIASVGKFYEFMVDTLRNIPKSSVFWKPERSNGSSSSIPWPEAAAGLTISRRYRATCAMRRYSANRSSPNISSTPRNLP